MRENFVDFELACESIMNIDEAVRFVGVSTNKGGMEYSKMRENTPSMLTPEQLKMSTYYAKLRHETREHLTNYIGKEEYSMTKYEKVILFTIPFEKDNLLMISSDADANHTKILNEVQKIIKKFSV